MPFLIPIRSLKRVGPLFIPRRQFMRKSEKHVSPTSKALQHFDDYYGNVFGKDWSSIRLALLCKPKKIALLNGFSTSENQAEAILISSGAQTIQSLMETSEIQKVDKPSERKAELQQLEDTTYIDMDYSPENRFSLEAFVPVSKMRFQEEVINESDYLTFYNSESESAKFMKEKELVLPKHWKAMAYPRGNISDFPTPVKDDIGIFPVNIMDGTSLLPVFALDIQPGDEVADLRAGTGDRTLAILFTMNPKSIFVSDTSSTNIKLLRRKVYEFIPEFFMKHIDLDIQQINFKFLTATKQFDKILLDVPCTDDRMSATDDENSFFSGSVVKKRNQLPYQLRDMLVSALNLLKVDGSLVYCTSTLSPVLNDGIVQEALYGSTENKDSSFVVNDMKESFKPFSSCFKMDLSFRYGILVLPFLPNNYGPMYLSKITRVS